jgi:hypothetical protein
VIAHVAWYEQPDIFRGDTMAILLVAGHRPGASLPLMCTRF